MIAPSQISAGDKGTQHATEIRSTLGADINFFRIQKKVMVQYTMVKADQEKTLLAVEPQLFYRGDLIIAEDVRGHFLFISQSMSGIQAGIEAVCHQVVSFTSLHESARREIRGGRTGGSWNVMRMERDVAIAHYN